MWTKRCTSLTGRYSGRRWWDFYFQAFNGLVSLPVARYKYNSDWTLLLAGLSPAGMAASHVIVPEVRVQKRIADDVTALADQNVLNDHGSLPSSVRSARSSDLCRESSAPALRIVIAPTVLTSYAPPRKTWIPNAMNTTIVAAAIADSCAARRLHKSNPKPAITYARPATKLNQRTKGTMLPAAALSSAPSNRVFPPDNNGDDAECDLDRGRYGGPVVLFMTCAIGGARDVINSALGVLQCGTIRFFIPAADKCDRDPEM